MEYLFAMVKIYTIFLFEMCMQSDCVTEYNYLDYENLCYRVKLFLDFLLYKYNLYFYTMRNISVSRAVKGFVRHSSPCLFKRIHFTFVGK